MWDANCTNQFAGFLTVCRVGINVFELTELLPHALEKKNGRPRPSHSSYPLHAAPAPLRDRDAVTCTRILFLRADVNLSD